MVNYSYIEIGDIFLGERQMKQDRNTVVKNKKQ